MASPESRAGALPPAEAVALAPLIGYAPGAIVSRALVQSKAGSVTLFAFDTGQGLSEHATPYDAHLLVLEGEALLTIGGREVRAGAGEITRMPADVPHSVEARGRMKMLLLMIRD